MKISANEIRVGMLLEYKNDLWEVLKTQHVKPGKGGAFAQVEMKSLNKNTKLNERFRSSEYLEKASVDEVKFNYSFSDENKYYFINPRTFDQIEIEKDLVGQKGSMLSENLEVMISIYNEKPRELYPLKILNLDTFWYLINYDVDYDSKGEEIFVKEFSQSYRNQFGVLQDGSIILAPNYNNLEIYNTDNTLNETLNLVNTVSSLNKTEFSRNDFKFGILFGCESSGLSNEDLITANQLIYIPSNSDFSSLNISHAVSLICWEFFKFFNYLILEQNSKISQNVSPTIKDMDYFYKNLCEKLNNSGFFHSDFMKKSIMENIKVLFIDFLYQDKIL